MITLILFSIYIYNQIGYLAYLLGSDFTDAISAPTTAHAIEMSIPIVYLNVPITSISYNRKAKYTKGAAIQKRMSCFLKLSPKL